MKDRFSVLDKTLLGCDTFLQKKIQRTANIIRVCVCIHVCVQMGGWVSTWVGAYVCVCMCMGECMCVHVVCTSVCACGVHVCVCMCVFYSCVDIEHQYLTIYWI